MGISYQQIITIPASRQVFLLLYHHVGACAMLPGGGEELLWSHRSSVLPWRL